MSRDLNRDFGAADNLNLAAKLYLLYRDTDINLLGYTGNSRSTRFGVAAARNLRPQLAIHGELAHVPRQSFPLLEDDGTVRAQTTAATSYLLAGGGGREYGEKANCHRLELRLRRFF